MYINANPKSRTFTDSRLSLNNVSRLCGFPSFCSVTAQQSCKNTTLLNCSDCSMSQAGILSAVYLIIGIAIILGNGLDLWNVFVKKKKYTQSYSKIRGSLAVANFISGNLK